MKILELRFKNLNSLYGEWVIDFTDPEYVSNGIFALTGPTGAGKSTILDAVCLALYGATPRLGKITKSGNEIMSRQTGECYSEVMFESRAGRFLSHWAQHRARRKADGNLIDARHEISDVRTGKPIETKKSLVPGVIEEKTGMDFDRFTRSMLLAQGGFDTFLKADVEQKSKILEQITGTQMYTQISRLVHERHRSEREKLNILNAETEGIIILTPEQETKIQQDLDAGQIKETKLADQLNQTANAIAWLTGIDELKKEILSLSETADRFQVELNAFMPQRERLDLAVKAAAFDGTYATLTAVRKQQKAEKSDFKLQSGRLPELKLFAENESQNLETAEQKTVKAKDDLKTAAPVIQKVRALDQKLTDQKKHIKESETGCRKEAAKIKKDSQFKLEVQDKQTAAHKELNALAAYFKEHAQDEQLVSGLAGIQEQINHLFLKQQEINQKTSKEHKAEKALKTAVQKLEACSQQVKTGKGKMADVVCAIEKVKKQLNALLGNRMLREYRTQKETLLREMAFLAKISELEAHRLKLEDGKPCPLCGAKVHPFALGNIPVPDETEQEIKDLTQLIQKAETYESRIKKMELEEKQVRENLVKNDRQEADAANEKKAIKKTIVDLTEDLKEQSAFFEKLKTVVLSRLQPFGIKKIPDSDLSSLIGALQKRLQEWQGRVENKNQIEKQLSDLDSELKRLDAVIETRTRTLAEKLAAQDLVKQEYNAGILERRQLFGTKCPDIEEKVLNKAIIHSEQAEIKIRKSHMYAQQQLNSTKAALASLTKRIEKRESELKGLELNFIGHVQSAGFKDENGFLTACLPALERDKLKIKAKDLDDRYTDLQIRQKDRKTRLNNDVSKKITDSTLRELEPQFKALEDGLKGLRNTIAGLNHQFSEDKAAKGRIKEKQDLIDAQKKECNRWDKLHGLIGSSDGKKYRNFAQGLTFELMVSHANRQLEKMTDRYLLVRDKNQPLALNVVDNYQAGEIRSTKNLSGGESFIVSLTLALGLSNMASQKVRVDSLFLDEGFGTLDDEALETALETLSSLHQDGKLIGIISHVSALKERISTQISVTPLSGGKSAVAGPGCGKLVK